MVSRGRHPRRSPAGARRRGGLVRRRYSERIAKKRIVGLGVAVAALAFAAGYGGWRVGRSDLDRVTALEGRVEALESAASSLAAERDRLKAERDRLETQLAAIDATPAACQEATSSTLDAGLFVRYIVEYPCGWSVLEEPLRRPEAGSPRAGLVVDQLFFSAFPISKTPRDGPLAEITLDRWRDDENVEGDAMPTFDAWVAEARSRFRSSEEDHFQNRSGIRVLEIDGTMEAFDEPRPAVLYLWEHTDTDGVRHIYEAFALDPSRSVRSVIEALVRSFRFPGG